MVDLTDSSIKPPRPETERLVLDGHLADDLDPLADMWADGRLVQHPGGRASTRQESWFRLLRHRGLWPVLGYGYWAARERQSGRFVGNVGHRQAVVRSGEPQFGCPHPVTLDACVRPYRPDVAYGQRTFRTMLPNDLDFAPRPRSPGSACSNVALPCDSG